MRKGTRRMRVLPGRGSGLFHRIIIGSEIQNLGCDGHAKNHQEADAYEDCADIAVGLQIEFVESDNAANTSNQSEKPE